MVLNTPFNAHIIVELHDDGITAILLHDIGFAAVAAGAGKRQASNADLEQREFHVRNFFRADDSGNGYDDRRMTAGMSVMMAVDSVNECQDGRLKAGMSFRMGGRGWRWATRRRRSFAI